MAASEEVEVWDFSRLKEEGMHGLIEVGKGSIHKPCMVFFRLNPNLDTEKHETAKELLEDIEQRFDMELESLQKDVKRLLDLLLKK